MDCPDLISASIQEFLCYCACLKPERATMILGPFMCLTTASNILSKVSVDCVYYAQLLDLRDAYLTMPSYICRMRKHMIVF